MIIDDDMNHGRFIMRVIPKATRVADVCEIRRWQIALGQAFNIDEFLVQLFHANIDDDTMIMMLKIFIILCHNTINLVYSISMMTMVTRGNKQ